jgi:hypothetical protein
MKFLDDMQRHVVNARAARDGGLMVGVAVPVDPHLRQPGFGGTELETAVHRDTFHGAHEQTLHVPRGAWHCASLRALPDPSLDCRRPAVVSGVGYHFGAVLQKIRMHVYQHIRAMLWTFVYERDMRQIHPSEG